MSFFAPLDNPLQLVILVFVGVFMGIANVLAGGGSLVSLPLLIFMGLDSAAANGTNRLAIVIQNIVATFGFKSKGIGNLRFDLWLIIPALPGVFLGAYTAASLDDEVFRKVLSVLMVVILVLILYKIRPDGKMIATEDAVTVKQKWQLAIGFIGIGFYAGFIQAGVGFFVIALMTWCSPLDLVRINAHKVLIIGVFMIVSLITFASLGRVIWPVAMVLAAGNAIGGWAGAHIAVAGGEKWIRRALIVAVVLMALKLSGIIGFIFS